MTDPDPSRSADLAGLVGRFSGAVTGRVVGAIDPDIVLDQIDVNALLDRVDVDRLLERVDVDRLLDRVDIDRLLERADVDALVRRSGVPDIVAESTGRFAGTALDTARRQLVVVDVLVARVVDSLLRRRRSAWGQSPSSLGTAEPVVSRDGRLDVTGRYAGPVTRLAAAAADVWLLATSGTLALAGLDFLSRTLFDAAITVDLSTQPWWLALAALGGFAYVFLSLEVAGRTPGMTLVGLRVVRRDGAPLGAWGSLVRTMMLPVSAILLGLGYLLAVVHPDRRALHDLVAGSSVVHDWTPRRVELPPAVSASMVDGSGPRSLVEPPPR
ncbi:RDD family protein [Nocardioides psychrotolerans]|uniref:RDD family protein n=1 Tax=Nocardioides psychrotolerans TaxID=1005945 RepID=UPI003137A19D